MMRYFVTNELQACIFEKGYELDHDTETCADPYVKARTSPILVWISYFIVLIVSVGVIYFIVHIKRNRNKNVSQVKRGIGCDFF